MLCDLSQCSWRLTLCIFQSLYVTSNEGLVDARLPSLNRSAVIVIENNRHLCPQNFPLEAGNCSVADIHASIALVGVTPSQLTQTETNRLLGAIATTTGLSLPQVRLR